MRIGIVTGEYPPAVGGVGDHTARLAHELVRRGHHVDVVTTAGAVSDTAEEWSTGGGGHRVRRVVPRWDWRILASLPRMATRYAWDVLHVQYQPAAYGLHPAVNVLPLWLRRLQRVRRQAPSLALVTTFHDLRVPYVLPKAEPLRRLAVRTLATHSHGAIAVAEEDVQALTAWTAGSGRRAIVAHVPLGNHFDEAPPADFDRDRWRSQIGAAPGGFVVGHLGFVNRSKAIDSLLRATDSLLREGSDVRLLMIGDELGASDVTNRAYLAEVRQLVGALGLAHHLHWTGHQSAAKVAGWLRCCDVVALPFAEGASLRRTSLIAAWAHGCPVLTTKPRWPAGWVAEPLLPAAVVPAPTPAALVGALRDLLAQPARRRALATAGQAYGARFAWPEVTRQTEAVYVEARRLTGR
jgi:glycosyltransferase involved in cell wall biosynthesis